MWEALFLLTAAAMPIDNVSGSDPALVRLLDRTAWIDIGLGRSLAAMTPKELAALRKCKTVTMAFRETGAGWEQIFYPGIEMRTRYDSAIAATDKAGITITLYAGPSSAPAETLRISPTHDVLVQKTPGFRPHTFLRCNFSPQNAKKGGR